MIHEICTSTFRAESKCIRRLENTLPLALQKGEGTYIKNNSGYAFKANTLFITLFSPPVFPWKNKHHSKQNLTWAKTASQVGMAADLPEVRGTHEMTFIQFPFNPIIHWTYLDIAYEGECGWVFKWKEQQRLTDSVLLQKGTWICTFIACISHVFIQAWGRQGDAASVKFT